MRDILKSILPEGYNQVKDLIGIGETNFLCGGLNIFYGMDGSGKSWQIVKALGCENNNVRNTVYLDTDGSNGLKFVKHCNKYGIEYISSDAIHNYPDGEDIFFKVLFLIRAITTSYKSQNKPYPPVFVIDSLSSIGEGREINNSEKISPLLYEINGIAEKHNICIILIDHATELWHKGELVGFKLEGNASAKRRTTVTVNRYEPIDETQPHLGGTIICERARGNNCGLSVGDVQEVLNEQKNSSLEWIIEKRPDWLIKKEITKTEFSRATKHKKDLWVRKYASQIFDEVKKGKTTYFILKENYKNQHSNLTL